MGIHVLVLGEFTVDTVTAKAAGSVTITATSSGNTSKTATCAIAVTAATVAVTGVSISGNSNVSVNKTLQLNAEILPANATNKTVTWSSSDSQKAIVSSTGLVTGKAEGTVVITATAKDGSGVKGTKTIKIEKLIVAVTGIKISPNPIVLYAPGGGLSTTGALTVTISPNNATNKNYTWSGNNSEIATVSGTTATAVKEGSTTVIATTESGDKTASTSIIVVTNLTDIAAKMIAAQNLWTGPSTAYSKIKTLSVDASVTIMASYGDFYYINVGGDRGFVLKSNVGIAGKFVRQGSWVEPTWKFDKGFPYNRNEKITAKDHLDFAIWGTLAVVAYLAWPDAARAYDHYRDATGTDLPVDLQKVYDNDEHQQAGYDYYLALAKSDIINFVRYSGANSFRFTSNLTTMPNEYYPSTTNWQKALGGYSFWIYGLYSKNGDSETLTVNIKVKDMYNFNGGQNDIATGVPDSVNGRFSVIGWAKEFISYGTFTYNETIH